MPVVWEDILEKKGYGCVNVDSGDDLFSNYLVNRRSGRARLLPGSHPAARVTPRNSTIATEITDTAS